MRYKIKVKLEYTDEVEAENFDEACDKVIEHALIWGVWSCDLIEEQHKKFRRDFKKTIDKYINE